MTKSQLIKWSAARDALNFVGIGQIPGICQLLDLPLIIMHFNYAGIAAVFTLLELIPMVGFFPIFTISAMAYPNRDQTPATPVRRVLRREDLEITDTAQRQPQLFALVDGELVPVKRPEDGFDEVRQVPSTRQLPRY